jgi:S1-C subfamily serine protease
MKNVFVILSILFMSSSYAGEYSYIRSVSKPVIVNDPKKDNILSSGSSVIIAPGYILSAFHIIAGIKIPYEIFIINDGILKPAKVVKSDERNDLVLLSADISCPCAEFLEGDVDIDEMVYSSTFPLFTLYDTQYVTTGIIQKFERKEFVTTLLSTFGSSGGPIFVKSDNKYKLFGLVQSIGKYKGQFYSWMSFGIRKHVIIDFLADTPASVQPI